MRIIMSDDARGHRGRHSGRVHGRVFPLPIVPSVIYGSTLSGKNPFPSVVVVVVLRVRA